MFIVIVLTWIFAQVSEGLQRCSLFICFVRITLCITSFFVIKHVLFDFSFFFFEVVILMLVMHVELTLTAGLKTKVPPVFSPKCMNTTGSSLLLFSLLSVSVPVCRLPPANEGDGRGGWVYLLTGHLRPGEQRLGQLLHQTGALRSQGQTEQDALGQDTSLKNPSKHQECGESN